MEKMMTTTKKTEKTVKVTKKADEVVKKAPAKTKSKSNQIWPKVEKGNHLTVITYQDGRTELIWDDEALRKEINDAIMNFMKEPKSTPSGRRPKSKS